MENNRKKLYEKLGLPSAVFVYAPIMCISGTIAGVGCVYCFSNLKYIDFGQLTFWALALSLLGALPGFIFGTPKRISNGGKTSDSDGENSTNLTDISEWLTKVVIGAGLVELKKIPSLILTVARHMSSGIAVNYNHPAESLCAAVFIYYTCFGFIMGYFMMRTIFATAFNRSEKRAADPKSIEL